MEVNKTQITTHISQAFQIKKMRDSLMKPINIHWREVSEVYNNMPQTQLGLKLIM